jgi:hypothetical protein
MSKLEQTDRIAHGVLIAAVVAACVSPFALGALKEGGIDDLDGSAGLFGHLDHDHSGAVNWVEAQRLPGLEAVFAQADTNHDGVLTRAEFARAQAALVYQRPPPGKAVPMKVRGAMVEQQYLPLAVGMENL